MLSLSGSQLLVIVVAVVLTVVVVGIFLLLASRLRKRRNQILDELSNKPEVIQDRAFNRIEMARREAQVVSRTGADITRAQEQIAQSQAAFDLHQYARSYELAQSAHETLVNSRARPASAAVPAVGGPPSSGTSVRPRSGAAATPSSPLPSTSAPLAKNRAQSHFELGLLESDLASAQQRAPNLGTTVEADAFRSQAQAAFDRSDYTEAFRLALRGRRALGSVETVALTSKATPTPANGMPDDATGVAERVAGFDRCPKCGNPMAPDDAFCRGCGVPRTGTACPACGAPRVPSDTFCGKCGARFST